MTCTNVASSTYVRQQMEVISDFLRDADPPAGRQHLIVLNDLFALYCCKADRADGTIVVEATFGPIDDKVNDLIWLTEADAAEAAASCKRAMLAAGSDVHSLEATHYAAALRRAMYVLSVGARSLKPCACEAGEVVDAALARIGGTA
jgi:hypothetical protein